MSTTHSILPDHIKEQVSKIVKTEQFKKSKILSDFLKFVVNETLEGNEQSLKEYVIATEVLKKKSDFNPQLDAVVRIHARRLRKILEDYYTGTGGHDTIRISMPKGRYIPVFEKNVNELAHKSSSQGADELIIETIPAIAVLPFKSVGNSERVCVICSVLCEALTVELSHAAELKVISNHSAEFASQNLQNWTEIVSHLGADYIITGSCYQEGKDIRINIELHHTSEDQVIWANSLSIADFEKSTLSQYNSVITKTVAIVSGYLGIIYRNTINAHIPQDYDVLYAIYWHNRFHKNFSMEAFQEASIAIEKALSINPESALLNAFKGELLLNLCAMDAEGDVDCFAEGSGMVRKAITLDPTCQHVWQVFAWSKLLGQNKMEYMRAAEKCLSLNRNNAMYMAAIGFGHQCAGEYEAGLELMLEGIDLNPFYPWETNLGLTMYYLHKKEFKEALYWADLIKRPGVLWDPLMRASVLGFLGETKEASIAVNDLLVLSPNFPERATFIVGRFIIDPELRETILEGLVLSGIEIAQIS